MDRIFKPYMNLDFSQLEEMVKKLQSIPNAMTVTQRGAGKQHIYDYSALYSNYAHTILTDELYYETPLKRKLHKSIEEFWTNNGTLVYRAMLEAMKNNPKTKDLYKGKASMHCFPWYHRNRKY